MVEFKRREIAKALPTGTNSIGTVGLDTGTNSVGTIGLDAGTNRIGSLSDTFIDRARTQLQKSDWFALNPQNGAATSSLRYTVPTDKVFFLTDVIAELSTGSETYATQLSLNTTDTYGSGVIVSFYCPVRDTNNIYPFQNVSVNFSKPFEMTETETLYGIAAGHAPRAAITWHGWEEDE